MFYVKLLKTPAENEYSEQYSNQQIYSILVGLVPVKNKNAYSRLFGVY